MTYTDYNPKGNSKNSLEYNINNPNTGDPTMDEFQRRNLSQYKARNTTTPTDGNGKKSSSTLGGRDYSEDAINQFKAQADATNRSADLAVDRSKRVDANALNTSRQRDSDVRNNESAGNYERFNMSQQTTREDRDFKRDESALDRNKSKDEFTQNRYQLAANQAQDRSNQEFGAKSTRELQKQQQDFDVVKQGRDILANAALQAAANANQIGLANISQQTSFGDQKTSLARAESSAKAQVTSALYGASPQYQGY